MTAKITNSHDIRKYYSIFINTTSTIARTFGAKIVKNVGDSVVFYFPHTVDVSNEQAFKSVLECCVKLNGASKAIADRLREEYLPEMQYRLSADYGTVEVATTRSSQQEDLFGSTINLCAKINKMAAPEKILIGGDLYQILKSLPSLSKYYDFRPAGEYSVGIKYSYPLYNVTSKYYKSSARSFKEFISVKSSINSNSQKIMQHANSPWRVMLIEDDNDTLVTYHTILTSEGIWVDSYKESRKAFIHLTKVEANYYDLIILDIRMPGLNGLEFYHKLKVINKEIKILFVTALDASRELVSVLSGFESDNLLRKPLEGGQLISAVKRLLANGTEAAIVNGK